MSDVNSNAPLLGEDGAPAKPSLLGTEALSAQQARLDERIRTLSLVICATAVVAAAIFYLQDILVRLVLALALKYLLSPLIDVINVEVTIRGLRCRIPRGLAIILAMCVAVGGLVIIGVLVTRSVVSFTAHVPEYRARIDQLLGTALNATSAIQQAVGGSRLKLNLRDKEAVMQLASNVNVAETILHTLGSFAHLTENSIYILLILAFLLAGSRPPSKHTGESVHTQAEQQIFAYIRGKVGISLLVATVDAGFLRFVGLDLWLVFGVLAFLLNFIPNVGMATSVLLPMPLVLLDENFGVASILVAFVGPLLVGMVAKDVLEPLLIGKSTSLQPVAVLLAIMLWGSVWGVTGMVLAVPMTAVGRIYLASVEHPLPRYVATVLAGDDAEGGMLGQGHGDMRDTADLVEREIEEPTDPLEGPRKGHGRELHHLGELRHGELR